MRQCRRSFLVDSQPTRLLAAIMMYPVVIARTKPNAPVMSNSYGLRTNRNAAAKTISANPDISEIKAAGPQPMRRPATGRGVQLGTSGRASGGGLTIGFGAGFGLGGGFGASNRTGCPQFGHFTQAPGASPSAFRTVPQLEQRSAVGAFGVAFFVDSNSSNGPAPHDVQDGSTPSQGDRTRTVRETEDIRCRNP
jgi:hypothetical protein